MTKRIRNYKEEYRRRIERAFELGYSRSVARGHPKKRELTITQERKIVLTNLKDYHEKPSREAYERMKDTVFTMREMAEGARAILVGGQVKYIHGTVQKTFIRIALEAGFTERQAYRLWFSP